MYFDELDLNDNVLDALYDMRFETCTPVQEQCIPEILKGNDLLGVAQTGTGKTAAYLLPILSKLDDGGYPKDAINCVIMSPTRELAQQIDQAMQGFGYYLNDVSSVAIYGGNDGNRYDQELKSLSLGADVVIATPGRLISHISMGNADFSRVSFFVLDEADRMLDMGFSEDIKKIAQLLPPTCQTIMFSATMPDKIEELAKTLLKNPVVVKLAVSKPAEKIKQTAYVCYETQKLGIIQDIFKQGDLKRVIIFSGKKQKVKAINRALMRMHVNSGEMHSDLDQAERDQMLYKFKSGQIDVLVATDILARGIDIDDIAMVINFDVPHDPEDYVHRIGRTARAQRDGVAITFVAEDEISSFKQIEKFLGREVEKNQLPEGLGEAPDYNAARSNGRGGKQRRGGNGESNGRGRGGNGRGRGKKRNATDEQNKSESKNAPTDKDAAATNTNNETKTQENTNPENSEQKPRKKRSRGPRQKKDVTAENGNNEATNKKPQQNRRKERPQGDGQKQQDEKRQSKQQTERQNKPQANRQDNKPQTDGQRRKQRRPSGRNNRNGEGRQNSAKTEQTKQQTSNVPAVKQTSAITQILKKPISWIKSLGKKKD